MKIQRISTLGLAVSIALLTACQGTQTPAPTASTPVTANQPKPIAGAATLMRLDFQKLNSDSPEATAQTLGPSLSAQGLTNVPTALAARVLSVSTFTYGTKRHVRTTVEFTYNGSADVNGPVILPVDTDADDPKKATIGSSPFINVLYFDQTDARQKVLDGKLNLVRGKKYDQTSQTAIDDLDATPLLTQDLTGFQAPSFDGVKSVTPYNFSGYQVTGLPNNKLKQGDKFIVNIGLDVDDVGTPAKDPFYASMFYLLAEGAPAVQEAQGIDRTIGISGDLSNLKLDTTDAGGGDLKIQNKTSAPVTVTIPAPQTADGQLKLNIGSALDTYSETISANQTATIPYLAECPIDEGTYTKEFEIRVGSEVKKSSVTVLCTEDQSSENDKLDTTKVLEPADERQLTTYNEEAKTATFASGSSFASSLVVGDVVVSDPIPDIAPDGLAFKIETISADKTSVTFSNADLGELFDEVDVDNTLTPSYNDIDLQSSKFLPGITAMAGDGETLLNLSFDQVLIGDKSKKDPNNYLIANGRILVNKPKLVFKAELNAPIVGSLKVDEALTLNERNGGLTTLSQEQTEYLLANWSFFNKIKNSVKSGISSATKFAENTAKQIASVGKDAVNLVKNAAQGVSFNSELSGEFSEQASLKIEGRANAKLTKKIMIGNVKFKPIALSLGGVPVTVTHELNIFIDMNGQVTGEVKYNVEQSFSYKAGIKYDSKSSPKVQPINEVKPTFTQEFQLYGNFDLDAKAVAEYEAKVFGNFGAFANAKIGPKVSARTEGDVLKLDGEICASGDAGTREFEFKIPVVGGIKLDGTNVNLFNSCFAKAPTQNISLPLVADLEYQANGETRKTNGITFDTVPELDYGPNVTFKLPVVNPQPNTSYLYQWGLDGAALEVGSEKRAFNLPASEIGKEKTLTAAVSVGNNPDVSLRKVTKKLTFKLKNSAPTVQFSSSDPLTTNIGDENTVEVKVTDNNQQLDCSQVRWSSNASGYEITGQGGSDGNCFVKMKFPSAGDAKIYAQVTDELNVTTTAERPVNVSAGIP